MISIREKIHEATKCHVINLRPLGNRWRGGQLVFTEKKDHREIKVPCNNCIGCRIDRSAQWALRLMHESELYEKNCFITLTYDCENIPFDGSLRKKDFQNFMKDLRKHYSVKYSKLNENYAPDLYKRGKKKDQVKIGYATVDKIKFYMCGEYGDKNGRPHYHAILFNHQFEDLEFVREGKGDYPILTSSTLQNIWKKGFVQVGELIYESAAYIARYVLKKVVGDATENIDPITGLKPYERFHSQTGQITEVWPEYSTMSRGGRNGHGIANDWIHNYTTDIYPKDYTTHRGNKYKPPRYYDEKLKEINEEIYERVKEGRKQMIAELSGDNTPERLQARERVARAKSKLLKRDL